MDYDNNFYIEESKITLDQKQFDKVILKVFKDLKEKKGIFGDYDGDCEGVKVAWVDKDGASWRKKFKKAFEKIVYNVEMGRLKDIPLCREFTSLKGNFGCFEIK